MKTDFTVAEEMHRRTNQSSIDSERNRGGNLVSWMVKGWRLICRTSKKTLCSTSTTSSLCQKLEKVPLWKRGSSEAQAHDQSPVISNQPPVLKESPSNKKCSTPPPPSDNQRTTEIAAQSRIELPTTFESTPAKHSRFQIRRTYIKQSSPHLRKACQRQRSNCKTRLRTTRRKARRPRNGSTHHSFWTKISWRYWMSTGRHAKGRASWIRPHRQGKGWRSSVYLKRRNGSKKSSLNM